jgi:magnesium chelatase family protein
MITRVSTIAFEGIDARPVDVQVQISPGNVAFIMVGLADKAVAESRERVRSALIASGLALPAKRITVNLAPADLPKEGSCQVDCFRQFHYIGQLFIGSDLRYDWSR